MKLWIDNTGLQSAGCCLEGQARSEIDIQGLFQLVTFLVFSENILINGFEADKIASKTKEIIDILKSLHVPSSAVQISPETRESYALACRNAAEDISDRLNYTYQPNESEILGLDPVDLPPRLADAHHAFLKHSIEMGSNEYLEQIEQYALNKKAIGAVDYMLSASPKLRAEVRKLVKRSKKWTQLDSFKLNAYMRFYLNHSLAKQRQATYGPSIARANLVRRYNFFIISHLCGSVDKIVKQLREIPLEVPSIISTLVQKSRGDPKAFVKESVVLREKTIPLRRHLGRRLENIDLETSEGRFQIDREIKNIIRELETDLGLHHSSENALDVSFNIGLPSPSVKGSALLNWIKKHWSKRRISVLSEMSKTAAFPEREDEFLLKLKRSFFKN